MSEQPFKPLVLEPRLKLLKPYYGYKKVANDGSGRNYLKLTTQPEQTTTLIVDGQAVEIQASFRASDYAKPDVIYLEIPVTQFDGLIASNAGSNLFWCAPGNTPEDQHTIVTDVDYQVHDRHFNS
tara:strand:+ start:230 stop:604 length:375 start_codon:yes stop_codon:yes gene_type:complete